MKSKERANLRAEAHRLQALVHVGHQGVTDAVVRATDEVLTTHELLKVDISRNLTAPVRQVAHALADATSSEVVQVIGRKAVLFRDNPELEWKGGIPPWR
jgi:RNA-binding protein